MPVFSVTRCPLCHRRQHPVLLTEAPLNPRLNRDVAAQIFFDTFNVPALFNSVQAVLSLYASGRTTGVVLDAGDGVTHAVPVFEGFSMPHAIRRIDLAGRDVTDYLQLLLRKAGHDLHTSAEREVVRTIKEKCCYIAQSPAKEEKEYSHPSAGSSSGVGSSGLGSSGVGASAGSGSNGVTRTEEFRLPDGSVITLGAERFRAPEILFNPELVGQEYPGVHQVVVDSITRADLDLRKDLFANIVLSGGSTLCKGFGDRLLNEVKRLAVKDVKIKIYAPPERKYSTWIGGSILAGLSTFKKVWNLSVMQSKLIDFVRRCGYQRRSIKKTRKLFTKSRHFDTALVIIQSPLSLRFLVAFSFIPTCVSPYTISFSECRCSIIYRYHIQLALIIR